MDYIWLPNLIDGETEFPQFNSMLCPWGQTLPFVARVAPHLAQIDGQWLDPTLHPRGGIERIQKELWPVSRRLG